METSLLSFVWRRSRREQFVILGLTVASVPFYFLSLEIPKLIVNKALGLQVASYPHPLDVLGLKLASLSQVTWLVLLCLAFLLAVLAAGALKFVLNVYKGQLGERLLGELRGLLLRRTLRLPLGHLRHLSGGELVNMVTSEVEPLGGYIGDALALPLYQGAMLLTAVLYIYLQDPIIGLAATALFPVQVWLVPRLQRQVLVLSRERVKEMRRLSARLGETATRVGEIHAAAQAGAEIAVLDGVLERVRQIRYALYRRKFFVKFLNNFLFQLTPFLFLLVGGLMVIRGEFSVGALVAVLAAYKDLPPPAKELLDYYQTQQDALLRYEQLVARLDAPRLYGEDFLAPPDPDATLLAGGLEVEALSVAEDGLEALDGVSFAVGEAEHVALVAAPLTTAALAGVLVQLIEPSTGTVRLGGRALADLPHSVVGRAVALVSEDPAFFDGTLGENLGLNGPADEAQAALLDALDLGEDLYRFGLRAVVDPERHAALVAGVLAVRRALREQFAAQTGPQALEALDPDLFWERASLAENLLGGTLVSGAWRREGEQATALARLAERAGLGEGLVRLGLRVARTLAARPAAMGARAEAEPLATPEDMVALRLALARGRRRRLRRADRRRLLLLALRLVPARDTAWRLPGALKRALLAARVAGAGAGQRGALAVARYDPERYAPGLSVQDNLVFARPAGAAPAVAAAVQATLRDMVVRHGLLRHVQQAALEFQVGAGGARLDAVQRCKLGLARALLREPMLLLVCRATRGLDAGAERRLVAAVRRLMAGRALVWMSDTAACAVAFDRALLFEGPRLAESGTPAALDRPGGRLRALTAAPEPDGAEAPHR